MRILLIGEYSRLHLTLAEGLRRLGHNVTVASDGDGLKKYPRDVDLTRKGSGIFDTLSAFLDINRKFKEFVDYDVVQLINPCFLTLSVRINRYFFNQLKRNNKKIFLGAFGDDTFWVNACLGNKIFKYSEFFVDGKSTQLDYCKILEKRWIGSGRARLNAHIVQHVDGVVACLYEYYKSYESFACHLKYIPLPINFEEIPFSELPQAPQKIKFFIGINKARSQYKGTDLMEKVLLEFAAKHADEVEVLKAESVSYDEYKTMMQESHVVLDQLYSYSPAMNALLAMAQGKLVISGGEPEMYDLMGADIINRPIVNVYPIEEGIWKALESVLQKKDKLQSLSRQSRLFVEQYHNSVTIAQQYFDFWMNK